MNVFIAKGELPPISKLFRKHIRHLVTRLHNLKFGDIDSEERFSKTLLFIKSAILLPPVMFGRPQFSGVFERQETSIFGTFTTKLRDVFIRQISFPFTGSRSLFYYTSSGDSVDKNAAILMPAEDSLDFQLDAVFYSRAEALKAARDRKPHQAESLKNLLQASELPHFY